MKLAERERGITLVIVGKAGSGISTLGKNLLCLPEDTLLVKRAVSVLRCIECYRGHIDGISTTLVDISGLTESNVSGLIADLTMITNRRVDVLLYCISMLPDSRVSELDSKIVELLTTAFTPHVWESAILVLTFADIVKEVNQEHTTSLTVQDTMKDYAETFEKLLQSLTDHNITVMPVLQDEGVKIRPVEQIAAMPAGKKLDEEILPHMMWNEFILDEIFRKCTPAALKESSGTWKSAETSTGMNIGAAVAGAVAVGAAAAVGAAGGGLGGIFGAAAAAAMIGGGGVIISGLGLAGNTFYGVRRSIQSAKEKHAQNREEIRKIRIEAETEHKKRGELGLTSLAVWQYNYSSIYDYNNIMRYKLFLVIGMRV